MEDGKEVFYAFTHPRHGEQDVVMQLNDLTVHDPARILSKLRGQRQEQESRHSCLGPTVASGPILAPHSRQEPGPWQAQTLGGATLEVHGSPGHGLCGKGLPGRRAADIDDGCRNLHGNLLQRINTDYANNTFVLDNNATLDLADGTTPSGALRQFDDPAGGRPDNAPILALPDATSNVASGTLRGGLFVVNPRTTPMEIIAETAPTTRSALIRTDWLCGGAKP